MPFVVTAPLMPLDGAVYAAGIRNGAAQLIKLNADAAATDEGRLCWTHQFDGPIATAPIGCGHRVFVIVGNSHAEDTKAILDALRKQFIPNKIVLLRPTEKDTDDITSIAEFTRGQSTLGGKATAYVCLNYECKLPTTDIVKMLELLNVKKQEKAKAS